jgi:hypothetical protein
MPSKEPRNPFYLLLLCAGFLFAITALAYAVVPTLEQEALEAGHPLPVSTVREWLRVKGAYGLGFELAAMTIFAAASMIVDRLRWRRQELEWRVANNIKENGSPVN